MELQLFNDVLVVRTEAQAPDEILEAIQRQLHVIGRVCEE